MKDPPLSHEKFMKLALAVARRNPAAPFGVVLVDREYGTVVSEGINRVSENPTWHGEMDAINNYAGLGGVNWESLTLYSTAEPCCMCQSAIIWSGIRNVVFGTSIQKLTQLNWRQFSLSAQQIVDAAEFHNGQIIGGVLSAECDGLFESAAQLKRTSTHSNIDAV